MAKTGETIAAIFGVVIFVLLLIVGFSALSAWFVMLMVNYLFTPAVLTAVFGTAQIGFWQAFVLSLLAGTLFKSTSTTTSSSK